MIQGGGSARVSAFTPVTPLAGLRERFGESFRVEHERGCSSYKQTPMLDDRVLAGPLELRSVEEDDGSTHEILTGDYASWVGSWAPSELPPGQTLREPRPLFRKLDAEAVLAAELP